MSLSTTGQVQTSTIHWMCNKMTWNNKCVCSSSQKVAAPSPPHSGLLIRRRASESGGLAQRSDPSVPESASLPLISAARSFLEPGRQTAADPPGSAAAPEAPHQISHQPARPPTPQTTPRPAAGSPDTRRETRELSDVLILFLISLLISAEFRLSLLQTLAAHFNHQRHAPAADPAHLRHPEPGPSGLPARDAGPSADPNPCAIVWECYVYKC